MATAMTNKVLIETFGATSGLGLAAKRVALVIAGVMALAISAKIAVPMWPVPITMGTFAVLALGAAYGPRLGLATIMTYMLVGVMGFDVFAGSSAESYGLAYMMGSTGGYLVGYVLATLALGVLAGMVWDRLVGKMAGAMFIGNALIYVPGLVGLGLIYGFDKPLLAWGLTPFLVGDAVKLVLAAMILPAAWKLVGRARG